VSGLLTNSPAAVIQQLIIDFGLGTAVADDDDWPVFLSTTVDSPDNCLTVYDTTGMHDGRHMVNGEVQEHHGFMVRVRSKRYSVGWSKAHVIAIAFDEQVRYTGVVIGTSTYSVREINRASGPIHLGKEVPENKRHLFTLNCFTALREL